VSTLDLSGGADRVITVELVLPDEPDVRWFALAVRVPLGDLDDLGVTARQVALNAAADARDLAERVVHPAVLDYRMAPRGAA
jgi:hypothetical protein